MLDERLSRRSFLGLLAGGAIVVAVGEWPSVAAPVVPASDVVTPVGVCKLEEVIVFGGDSSGMFTVSRVGSTDAILQCGIGPKGCFRWVAAPLEGIVMPDGMPSVVIQTAEGQKWYAMWTDETDGLWQTDSNGKTIYCGKAVPFDGERSWVNDDDEDWDDEDWDA